jgi:GNAT superfamily N-acetyltransferase
MASFSDWDSRVFDYRVGTHKYTELPRDIGDTEGLDVVFARGPYRGQLPDPRSTVFEIQVDLRCDKKTKRFYPSLPLASDEDFSAVLSIAERTLSGHRWGDDPRLAPHAKLFYREWLRAAREREQVQVLRKPTGCAGFIVTEQSANDRRLSLIAVDPSFQRRGYGKLLLQEFLGQEGDVHRVKTWITNTAALNFYFQNGFRVETVECVEHVWLTR